MIDQPPHSTAEWTRRAEASRARSRLRRTKRSARRQRAFQAFCVIVAGGCVLTIWLLYATKAI